MLYPKSYLTASTARGFWLGLGTVGVVWLLRKQLRPVAVSGAKGLLTLTQGTNRIFRRTKKEFGGIVEEAKINTLRAKIESLDLDREQLNLLRREVSQMSDQLGILNKVITEQWAKEHRKDEPL